VKRQAITHQFVEFIPDELEEGIIYITTEYATAVHRCCCGCGSEVVTNFSPTDWKLVFDGETISLDPSVGNWSFPCQSHYWIRRNRVAWAGQMSRAQIKAGRTRDRSLKDAYFDEVSTTPEAEAVSRPPPVRCKRMRERVKPWLSR
jgi:hypothetical protein